jgi:hypothetical protein
MRATDVAADETSWEALERPTLRLTMAWLSCVAISSPVIAWAVLSNKPRAVRRVALLAVVSIVMYAAAVGAVLQIMADYRTAPVDWEHVIEIAVPFAAIALMYLALATSALFLFRQRRYRLMRVTPAKESRTEVEGHQGHEGPETISHSN